MMKEFQNWVCRNIGRKNENAIIDYKIWEMNCPVSKDSFEEFTKKEAAIYFAEVFRRNNEDWVSWGFVTKPKSYISVNRPVLTGFKVDYLDPTLLLQNCTLKAMDQKEKNMLYDLYHIWLEYQEK